VTGTEPARSPPFWSRIGSNRAWHDDYLLGQRTANARFAAPTMKPTTLASCLLLAACTTAPVSSAEDVPGGYACQVGPDRRDHLELQQGGLLTWACWSNFVETRGTGTWTTCADEITVEIVRSEKWAASPDAATMALRRRGGHVYLVPFPSVRYFDQYGPVLGLCFAREDDHDIRYFRAPATDGATESAR